MKKHTITVFIFIIILLTIFYSCKTYFKVSNNDIRSQKTRYHSVNKNLSNNRFLILHLGTAKAYAMDSVKISSDSLYITCKLKELPANHKVYENYGDGLVTDEFYSYDPNKYWNERSRKGEYRTLAETHFYLNPYSANNLLKSNPVSTKIYLNEITKIVNYDLDYSKNTQDFAKAVGFTSICLLSAAAIGALGYGIYAFVNIAVVAIKGSCPFVYVNDGGNLYYYAGEIFSGAFYPQLEKHDVLFLNSSGKGDTLNVILANQLKEKQFINYAEVKAFEIENNSEITSDQNCNTFKVLKKQSPTIAVSDQNIDIKHLIEKSDSVFWHFSDNESTDNDIKYLYCQFNKQDSKNALLCLNLKNTLLLDNSYYKFTELTGTMYNKFYAKQKEKTKEELKKWSEDQGIPLSVYVKNHKNKWELIKKIDVVGPLGFKEVALEINLKEVKGDKLEVKLECGTMFWELDEVSISYNFESITPKTLECYHSIDMDGKSIEHLIRTNDSSYVVLPEIGNKIILSYKKLKPKAGHKICYMLFASGYYTHIRNFEQKPDIAKLMKFRKKGYFIRFSRDLYKQYLISVRKDFLVKK